MEQRLTGMGFSLALLFGLVGMGIWGALSFALGIHFRPITWVMGGLIGSGMAWGRSRGPLAAMVAVMILLVTVAGGKLMAAQIEIRREKISLFKTILTQEFYNAEVSAARDLAAVEGEVDMVTFMQEHSSMGEDVDAETARLYTTYAMPRLMKLADEGVDYEAWEQEARSDLELLIRTEFTVGKILILGFNFFDLLFIALAAGTCIKLTTGSNS